jgi:hypothetical protein
MSDAPPIPDETLLVTLRRMNAETEKFIAEQRKLSAEQQKLSAEQQKLYTEGLKLERDRLLAPIIAVGGLFVGGMGLVVAILVALLRH